MSDRPVPPAASPEVIAWLRRQGARMAFHCADELEAPDAPPPAPLAKTRGRGELRALSKATEVLNRAEKDPR